MLAMRRSAAFALHLQRLGSPCIDRGRGYCNTRQNGAHLPQLHQSDGQFLITEFAAERPVDQLRNL